MANPLATGLLAPVPVEHLGPSSRSLADAPIRAWNSRFTCSVAPAERGGHPLRDGQGTTPSLAAARRAVSTPTELSCS